MAWIMRETDSSLVYLVSRPRQSTPSELPPLLLLLHGIGSNEKDLYSLVPYLDPRFLVISARAPQPWNSGYAWFELVFTEAGPVADLDEILQSYQQLYQFLLTVTARYQADPKQIYVMGFSQGAMMSLCLALLQPQLLAGVVIMSGRLDTELIAQIQDPIDLNHLPIFVAHGLYDTVLPIDYGRYIRDQLNQLPVQLTYKEYPMSHQVSEESLGDISNWLTQLLDVGLETE